MTAVVATLALALALATAPVSSSTAARTREAIYREAAITNAAAAETALGNLDACRVELDANQRLTTALRARAVATVDPAAATPAWLWGVAGFGLGAAIAAVATVAALGGR